MNRDQYAKKGEMLGYQQDDSFFQKPEQQGEQTLEGSKANLLPIARILAITDQDFKTREQ